LQKKLASGHETQFREQTSLLRNVLMAKAFKKLRFVLRI